VADVERSVAEASKLLARGACELNLQIARHKLSRSSLSEVADSARKAADILDAVAKRNIRDNV
jgi:hypothetical protein